MIDINIYKMYEKQRPMVYAYKCPSCKKLYYPAVMICNKCNTRRDPSGVYFSEWEKVPLEGKCNLLTWSKVFALPEGYEIPYLVFGIVEFKNGIRASGRLLVDAPKTGMELDASAGIVKEKSYEEIYGLMFNIP